MSASRLQGLIAVTLGTICSALSLAQADQLFDTQKIRDHQTLEVTVMQPWHDVSGQVRTRQKLVTINVGEIWPGQEFRVPVRMIVPANTRAKGFHLTGSNTPMKLEQEAGLNELEQILIEGGVGLVKTVVQEPRTYGQAALANEAERRFARTLNPRYKIQYWAWPATLMRAITLAYSERNHFEAGKVAVSGGSKNGASPSMAIIHDPRMTAIHASVSPIWDSPLRSYDRRAWGVLESTQERRGVFSGGHFGPSFHEAVLSAGYGWNDLERFAAEISDDVFISRNLDQLRERNVAMLFHPGTHDMVAYDVLWGGMHHPGIPIYLGANTGHGKKGHPQLERDQQNKSAFLLSHFFPQQTQGLMLVPPKVDVKTVQDAVEVRVKFPKGTQAETGRIWWMENRADDGTPRYLSELIPPDNSLPMHYDEKDDLWFATIVTRPQVKTLDVFSNHRKTLVFKGNSYSTYLSSPYTRVIISER